MITVGIDTVLMHFQAKDEAEGAEYFLINNFILLYIILDIPSLSVDIVGYKVTRS